MKPEEQRIAIAEVCGITIQQMLPSGEWFGKSEDQVWIKVPDYLNDLNAVHEAEKALTEEKAWVYARELAKLQGAAGGVGSGDMSQWQFHATASQRAEAFLKTLNLWKEEIKP